jgi:Bacterial archaeo-eukaryotic release factor family 3
MKAMNLLTARDLKGLTGKCGQACVSIYMPTHIRGMDTQQDPIRLKNLLKQAEELLVQKGLRSPEVKAMLQPAHKLVQDTLFWSHQGDGLAIFLSTDNTAIHCLPFNFEELVVVADRFHVKPLLPLLSGDGRFYVLALSQNQVRLLKGTRFSIEGMELEGVPQSLDEVLQYDVFEKQLQWHSPKGGAAGKVGVSQGRGALEADTKENILRYLREIDKGLHNVLGNEQSPLVVACVDYLLPIYREANTYPNLLDRGISGNPEGLSAQELHANAWEIVQPHFQKAQDDAVARYYKLAGTGRTAKDLQKVVEAACDGRIEVLFAALGIQRWGTFDPDTNSVNLHSEQQSDDEDLLDFAAIQTFLNSGIVYAIEAEHVPDDRNLAAILRY